MSLLPILAGIVGASAALIATTTTAFAETRRYVVIVAENRSLDANVPPLRFADDDGARYYELFAAMGDDVTLLAVLDADTQRQHRGLAKKTVPPTLANLREALGRVNAAMRVDRERNDTPVLYFIYAGHGDRGDSGEGYVNLRDVRFTRSDFFREILQPSSASFNHVIVDACNSYYLVNARGGANETSGWRDDRSADDHAVEVATFLAAEDLARYPNTGVILSTSSAEETHEWDAYRAGIFSHEVRSALSGAGDVNGDGVVEYSELKAFVAAANAAVDDPKAKLRIFAAAPAADVAAPLADLGDSKLPHFLVVPKGVVGHLYLEDDRGVRYADLHGEGAHEITIGLAPAAYYYLRSSTRELRVDLGKTRVHRADGGWNEIRVASRGSTDDTYRRGLFETPYGQSFYRGYVVSTGDVPVEAKAAAWLPSASDARDSATELRRPLRPWIWIAGGVAVSAGIGALVFEQVAIREQNEFQTRLEQTGQADAALADAVERHRLTRSVLLGVSIVAVGTGVTLYLLDRRQGSRAPLVSVGTTSDFSGVIVGVDGRF